MGIIGNGDYDDVAIEEEPETPRPIFTGITYCPYTKHFSVKAASVLEVLLLGKVTELVYNETGGDIDKIMKNPEIVWERYQQITEKYRNPQKNPAD